MKTLAPATIVLLEDRALPPEPIEDVAAELTAAGLMMGQAREVARICREELVTPGTCEASLAVLAIPGVSFHLLGPLQDRVLLLVNGQEERLVLVSLGLPLVNSGIVKVHGFDQVLKRSRYQWEVAATPGILKRLLEPSVLMVGLYHPENFPLPRFHLAISDIAYSIRSGFIGKVHLMDMQLSTTMADVIGHIEVHRPQIIGISATFGQHDKLTELMTWIAAMPGYNPTVVCGGSLSVLIRESIVSTYPAAIVANGPGERTMAEIVLSWHGKVAMDAVTDITYMSAEGPAATKKLPNKAYNEGVPELDLLEKTLEHKGVMQLESSRGCTYACSFCPRAHKGMWSGYEHTALRRVVQELGAIYDRKQVVSRRLFLVDEEYVGYRDDAEERGLDIARLLREFNFTFETSTRVDQVVRPIRDKTWHVKRMKFWRDVVETGLDRCLFGVESGVDSILRRFNKKTTSEQNARAVRTLTALGVPIRITYITFDHLMSMDELIESYVFLGRRDIILSRHENGDLEELFDIVQDDQRSAEAASGRPFHVNVSYMLVTMEALIGSKYLEYLEDAGLADEYKYSMGCRRARFQDARIGAMSDLSQRLVDRNFSLDYMIKSLQKVASREGRKPFDDLRVILKEYYYLFLGICIHVAVGAPEVTAARCRLVGDSQIASLREEARSDPDSLKRCLMDALGYVYDHMILEFEGCLDVISEDIGEEATHLIRQQMIKSKTSDGWSLIND
jgi:Fe-S oxidoreductase